MLLNLILTILCGATGVLLLEKWGVDDYMNTHGYWCKYWPAQPCLLCRGFWFGVLTFGLLSLWPGSVFLFVPLAAVPMQVFLTKVLQEK